MSGVSVASRYQIHHQIGRFKRFQTRNHSSLEKIDQNFFPRQFWLLALLEASNQPTDPSGGWPILTAKVKHVPSRARRRLIAESHQGSSNVSPHSTSAMCGTQPGGRWWCPDASHMTTVGVFNGSHSPLKNTSEKRSKKRNLTPQGDSCPICFSRI